MPFDAALTMSAAPAPLVARNAALDWAFYDIGNLSSAEIGLLAAETTLEGAIIAVHPDRAKAGIAVEKFEGLRGFRAATGVRIRHFAIAGVGSSDMGAAALARTLANHLGETVGAIVPGYGAADLVAEAWGGWFLFGHARPGLRPTLTPRAAAAALAAAETAEPGGRAHGWDAATLLRLLGDPDRRIETLLGHSRGGQALAFALGALALGAPAAFARVAHARIVTAGAVQTMPDGLTDVTQFLGALDWVGEMNSARGAPRVSAPGAWHHLNTRIPAHLDLGAALDGRFG